MPAFIEHLLCALQVWSPMTPTKEEIIPEAPTSGGLAMVEEMGCSAQPGEGNLQARSGCRQWVAMTKRKHHRAGFWSNQPPQSLAEGRPGERTPAAGWRAVRSPSDTQGEGFQLNRPGRIPDKPGQCREEHRSPKLKAQGRRGLRGAGSDSGRGEGPLVGCRPPQQSWAPHRMCGIRGSGAGRPGESGT